MTATVQLSLSACLAGGICLYIGAFAARLGDSPSLTAIGVYLGALVGALIIRLIHLQKEPKTNNTLKSYFSLSSRNLYPITSGALLSIATLFYFESVSRGLNIGAATLFFQSGFLLSSVLAVPIFSERLTLRRILGWTFLALALLILGARA